MNVTMVGAGYVGLVSSACFAEFGANVTCIDIDSARIDKLREGVIPIYEPGLEALINKNREQGRLAFRDGYDDAIAECDLVFIAVGTPARRGDGHADLNYVHQAARDIAQYLEGYTVIVDKSTVPVGTARNVKRIVGEVNPRAEFDVASNPEFLREGAALADFMRPDRVVIGVESKRAEQVLRELYRPLNLIETPMVVPTWKAPSDQIRGQRVPGTRSSFINEISALCEAVNADVTPLPGNRALTGGSAESFCTRAVTRFCFPKDTRALVRIAQENNVTSRIVEAVIEVNEAQKARMVGKIRTALGGSENGRTLAVLGLAFKPETDDMRDAPALSILPKLIGNGAAIQAHDPQAMPEARALLPESVLYFDDIYAALSGADAAVLMTEWNAYRGMDLERVKGLMRGNVFIDLRNVYEPGLMRAAGFDYHCVGR